MGVLTDLDVSALSVSVRLATTTVIVLLIVGTPLAWWLAHTRSRLRPIVEAAVALPIVLPPTVLGFYILVALGPYGPLGRLANLNLAFTFTGLVIASVFYSMPFVIQPLQGAFEAAGKAPLEAAWSLRASPLDAFLTVISPIALRGYVSAIVLGFAHTIGEFGVVLMVGGSIPGQTRVLSTTIFDHVEVMEYGQAHALSAFLLIFSFLVLLAVYMVNRRFPIHVS
jgi:molybdate transport system permease protein